MKPSKPIYKTAKNASKMHIHVGQLLEEIYPGYEIRQEYRVSAVNPQFGSNREKYDWVVLGMNIVIEVHGLQHFTPIRFGGISEDQAKANFIKQKARDQDKKQAARNAGWAYIVVKYTDTDMAKEDLEQRIINAIDSLPYKKKIILDTKQSTWYKGQQSKWQKTTMPKRDKYNWPNRKIPSRPFSKREE